MWGYLMIDKDGCLKYLEINEIDYELVEHGAVYTIEEAMNEPALKGRTEVKNLFIQDDKGRRQYLVMMPGLKRLDLKKLAGEIREKKVRFCSSNKVEKMLGVQPGSVSLFCCLNDTAAHVSIIVDDELLQENEVGLHPIVNTATIFFRGDNFRKLLSQFDRVKILKI